MNLDRVDANQRNDTPRTHFTPSARRECAADTLANFDTPGFEAERVFVRKIGHSLPMAGNATTGFLSGTVREKCASRDLALSGGTLFVEGSAAAHRLPSVRGGSRSRRDRPMLIGVSFGGSITAPPPSHSPEHAALRKAAGELEAVSPNELLEAIRETVLEGSEVDGGAGEGAFSCPKDQHLSSQAVSGSDRGMGAALYRQLRDLAPPWIEATAAPVVNCGEVQ